MNTQVLGYQSELKSGVWRNPIVLLLMSGLLVGANFPLTKLASAEQMPAALWVSLNSLGASTTLLVLLCWRGAFRVPRIGEWRYALIAGPITFALPSFLVFLVVPHVGAGMSGVMFALSPLCTALLAGALRLARLSALTLVGVILGMSGAMGMAAMQGLNSALNSQWLWLTAAIPLLLAAGNVYRTLDWPRGATPGLLAFWSHLVAFTVYGGYAAANQQFAVAVSLETANILLAQLALGALTAPLVFRLQRFGGPVLLSQIGYIAAATSLVLATLFLGERYFWLSWVCAGWVLVGVLIVVKARASEV